MTYIKDFIRKWLVKMPFKITQNQWYDHCTERIMAKSLHANSNCIDIGCHKGEFMDIILHYAPHGLHVGFEPLPDMYSSLKSKYQHQPNVTIYPYALCNEEGSSSFNHVKTNPAYSGLLKRSYDQDNMEDETIQVDTTCLDIILPNNQKVDLIKIDVEGGEYGVLLGASHTLKSSKPLLIFEHGIGASDYYNTTPEMLYSFLEKHNYNVFTLEDFLHQKTPLSKSAFEKQFYQNLNYYFVAQYYP